MKQLSRERLEEIRDYDTCVTLDESAEMARRLLAVEGREPVGEVVLGSRDDEGNYPHAHAICLAGDGCADWDNFPDGFKLYASPQPAPVAALTEYLPCDVRVGESVTIKKGNEVSTLLEVLRVQDATSCRKYDFLIDSAGTPVAQPVQVPPEKWVNPDIHYADENGFAEGWNACLAAMLKAEPVSQPYKLPDGYVLVPKKLTADNGAKSVMSGEFSETKFINCPECFGDEECETCDGSGRIEITLPVSWTNIKAIWEKAVEHFAAAPQEPTK